MATALNSHDVTRRLKSLNGWSLAGGEIRKTYGFKNYYETMAFVNAIALIAHRADHHPDLEVFFPLDDDTPASLRALKEPPARPDPSPALRR